VSDNSDIIVIPVYDTWIDDEEKYVAYVKSQVGEIAKRDWHSWFMLGIPTHKKYPETIENALNTWGNEVIKYPKSRFLGVSIFSEWTMDSSEWEIFEDYDASRYAKEDKKG
jgi:hypothetical protein